MPRPVFGQDGTVLMTTVTEGEGWKKPSRLDRASVRLTTAAAAAAAEPRKSVERVLTLGRAELGAGVDAALMQVRCLLGRRA